MLKDYYTKGTTNVSCATVHQFQGSESDVIVFDAVESYPKSAVGYLMGKEPNQVARLINVAITRGKGKVITVANARFWENVFKGTNHIFYKLLQHIKNGKHHVIDNHDKTLQPYIESVNPGRMINIFMNEQDAISMFEQDMKKAICWYERAAEQNHPAAMNSLGECYAMGRGVPRDLETAMEWYRRAAELGEAMADYNMGWHLEQAGKLSEAYAHYRKAADGNDDSAWWALGRFYENGVVVAQDGKEARRCYETGEKLGSVKCKMRLARCKLLGIGGRREKKAGLDLCRQALELAKESSEKEDYGYEAEMNLLRRTIAENES